MGGGGVALASVHVIISGGQPGAYCWIKNTFCRWVYMIHAYSKLVLRPTVSVFYF